MPNGKGSLEGCYCQHFQNDVVKKGVAEIADFVGQDVVVRVDRKPIDENLLDGFVVGISDKLLLLHVVDGSTLLLNGYSTVRLSDIRAFRVDETFISRAL